MHDVFRFQNLPSTSREEVRSLEAFHTVFTEDLVSDYLYQELSNVLAKYIHCHFEWNPIEHSQFVTFEQFSQLTLPPTLLLQMSVLPSGKRMLVEFSPKIAAMMVDKALGGTGQDVTTGRALTSVEEGIFTFLVLKSVEFLQNTWSSRLPLDFKLEAIYDELEGLQAEQFQDEVFFRREVQIALEGQHGFCRIYFPTTVLDELASSHPTFSQRELTWDVLQRHMHRIQDIPARGSFRVGTVELSDADLYGLEIEDIVLLQECFVHQAEDSTIQGASILQFGPYAEAGFRCSILHEPTSPSTFVQLDEIVHIQVPIPRGQVDRREFEDMSDNHDHPSEYAGGEQNYDQMAPIVGSVAVPIVVELGRVESTTKEIMGLHLGQVIELQRSPYEPLDLVVNGQVFGQGQLVEIEGQIGLKIVKLYH